jgi:DNA-directed RNA polymerase subunit F
MHEERTRSFLEKFRKLTTIKATKIRQDIVSRIIGMNKEYRYQIDINA